MIQLISQKGCIQSKAKSISTMYKDVYTNTKFSQTIQACIWRHLTDTTLYNSFYGQIESYIIEYPQIYQFQDEILQNIKDYTKAYKYLPIIDGVFNNNARIEVNEWFNKAIVYNGQQSSGLLELIAKPKNNLKNYLQYPIFMDDRKIITFTKSNNFYQYNTFWDIVKNKEIPLFRTSCESLSVDKEINQDNMNYTVKSFHKAPLRAKDVKIRHILDNVDNLRLVSQFTVSISQQSYK